MARLEAKHGAPRGLTRVLAWAPGELRGGTRAWSCRVNAYPTPGDGAPSFLHTERADDCGAPRRSP